MIEVKGLVKRYGDCNAVDHLSFTVEDRRVFGFLGPNGAGKSTTMNIITGYLAPTEGQVLIDGHDILEEPEAARQCIGYLPELPPLYPDMTVEEYLRFCAELKKLPRQVRREAVGEAVALTRLEDVSRRLIRSLSKGFRQRVGLAQAILGFPKIIILDEPTVGLDPRQVVEIRELVRDLAREHTVLISSHILSEIRAVCDRVLILRKGKLVACDTPAALEAKLSAGKGLEAVLKTDPDGAERLLGRLPELAEQPVPEMTAEGVKLTLLGERDLREPLFRACAEAGVPILELRPRTATLEQAFLDLTDENDAVAARALAALGGGAPAQETEAGDAQKQEAGVDTPADSAPEKTPPAADALPISDAPSKDSLPGKADGAASADSAPEKEPPAADALPISDAPSKDSLPEEAGEAAPEADREQEADRT